MKHSKLALFAIAIGSLFVINSASAQTTFYPAKGIWNGFFAQINITECDNNNTQPVDVKLTLTTSAGVELAMRDFSIAPFGSVHTILNDLGDLTDNHGVYSLALGAGQEFLGDKLNCRTVFYRPAAPGTGKQFDYAFSLAVQNAQSGPLSGIYNSFDPSLGSNISNNWLSIINLDPNPFSAKVKIFAADGSVQDEVTVGSLPAGGRQDIPMGHPLGQVTGLYIVEPVDGAQLYDATLIRYNLSPAGGFNFAFPLRGTGGSCTGQPVLASTMGNGLTKNWLATANVSDVDIEITIEVRDRFGALVHAERPMVPAKGQYHLFLSDKIDPTGVGNVGSARVLCDDPTDKLIIQSVYYGAVAGKEPVEWAYSTQELGRSPVSLNAKISAPANTFVGMSNWFKFADASIQDSVLDFNLFDQAGTTVAAGEQALTGGGTADLGIHTMLGVDQVGSVSVSSSTATASYSGEMLRVLSRTDGQIGNIISIPGIVQQNGVSGGSFRGDPQSLAQYRDKLTESEAARLLTVASFGGTKADIDRVIGEGLSAAVSRFTTFVSEPSSLVNEANDWLDGRQGDGPPDPVNHRLTHKGVKYWWLTYILKSPNPLKERLALFLHDRFASSCRVLGTDNEMEKCLTHMQLFRTHAIGDYGALMQAMTTDYLMLVWLNGNLNVSVSPDENYAREIMELFSLGEKQTYGAGLRFPLYSETGEIREFARALTGYTTQLVNDQFGRDYSVVFNVTRHDSGTKTVWPGTPHELSGSFEPLEVPGVILSQRPREVARYLTGALFTAFCHDHPTEQLRATMGNVLIASNWNTEALIRRILKSEACFSEDAHKAKMMNPVLFAAGFLRRTGIPMRVDRLAIELAEMGEDITDPVDVFGWRKGMREKEDDETTFWNAFMVEYANFLTAALTRHKRDFVDPNTGDPIFDFCSLNPSPQARSDEVVDHLETIQGTQFTASERTQYVRYLDNRTTGTDPNTGDPIEEPDLYDARVSAMCEQKLGGVLWMSSLNAMTY